MAQQNILSKRPHWHTLAAFGAVALALVGAIILIFNTIEGERREREQMQRTSDILVELNNVNRAAINGETGQRGYFITLDRRYLGPYLAAREQYRPALDRLREGLGEEISERQGELYTEIETLTEEKFADLDETVAQIERGELIEAQQQILTDQGQETMARLRQAISEMEQIEDQLLTEASGDVAASEGRVLPLVALLFLLVIGTLILGYRQVARAASAEEAAAQADALAKAHDRADLLARELNHRVKNLFAVILAIIRMTGRGKPEAEPVLEQIDQRIRALLIAHEATQGALDEPMADLHTLIKTTLAPYEDEATSALIDGPHVGLPAKVATPLGLSIHELTTNAVKYGAWSQGGQIDILWTVQDDMLSIEWTEHCPQGCSASNSEGFGSMLMQGSARQLDGTITREFTDKGIRVRIAFPITDG